MCLIQHEYVHVCIRHRKRNRNYRHIRTHNNFKTKPLPMPLIKTGDIESALQALQKVLITFPPHMLLKMKLNSTKNVELWGWRKTLNMFWGLMFNSNDKMNCYCGINFASLIPMRLHTLVCFPQHHKPSLRSTATPDNLIGFRNHSEWVLRCPWVPCHYQRGTKRTHPKVRRDTAENHCARGSAWVS